MDGGVGAEAGAHFDLGRVTEDVVLLGVDEDVAKPAGVESVFEHGLVMAEGAVDAGGLAEDGQGFGLVLVVQIDEGAPPQIGVLKDIAVFDYGDWVGVYATGCEDAFQIHHMILGRHAVVGGQEEGDAGVVGKKLSNCVVEDGHVASGLGVIGGKGVHRVVGSGDVYDVEGVLGH